MRTSKVYISWHCCQRKAWSLAWPFCLAHQPSPHYETIQHRVSTDGKQFQQSEITLQCFPLYSALAALHITTVNLLRNSQYVCQE